MHTQQSPKLQELASLRHKNQAQKEEFYEEMEKLLKGSPFLNILEGFSRPERIEVDKLSSDLQLLQSRAVS
jgi:hypothetical protein